MTFRRTTVCMAIIFFLFFFLGASGAAFARQLQQGELAQKETPTPQSPEDSAIQDAFRKTMQQNRSKILGLQLFDAVIDHITYSDDRKTAIVWMALRDPQSGEIVASEPGLSIAHAARPAVLGESSSWNFTLQQDSNFTQQLTELPKELLSTDIQNQFLTPPTSPNLIAGAPLRGYKLPWTAGLAKRVTNSIGHVMAVSDGLASCPASCRYAYDFADGTMFPLLAAKGGTVRAYKTTCSNGDTNCTNYLILEDQSTIPTSYQLYYHMANESVPSRLRTIGTAVTQGEYIGDADDTGLSTGHHLHFHVYTVPTGSNWSWGNSVDFVFEDVATNSGYPRTCAEAAAYPSLGSQCMPNNLYTSGNTPANPPSGQLNSPADRQVVTTRNLTVTGSAADDVAISRIQVLVDYDGTWKAIADILPVSGSFSQAVDLCSANVPSGPFGITLRIYDREGSQAKNVPVHQVVWYGSCNADNQPPPPPACVPSADQVALYADKDFQGSCTRFNLNNSSGYTDTMLGAVGDNQTASIQVGKNVRAIVYDKSTDVVAARVTGRMEAISASDASLADNQVGADSISGLWVVSSTDLLDTPYINSFGNMNSGANPSSLDSLVFSWEGGSGATGYTLGLTGPGTNRSETVTGRTSLSVGSLAAGNYTLTVKANPINPATAKSVVKTFSVTSAAFPAAPTRTAPYLEKFEGGSGEWTASGLWRYGSISMGSRGASKAWVNNNGTNYTDSVWRAGDLTSPPIILPAGSAYYLRFAYYADVENGNPYWDQRRLQISDGGLFKDVYQFSDDKQSVQEWLNSGPIDLSAYAGKTIRLRFHFDTIDEDYNLGAGWAIDDINVDSQAPNTSCADADGPDTRAPSIALDSSVTGVICPERDIDYYRFTARAGQTVRLDINARNLTPASQLDSYLSLLDADGRSVIAENDDEAGGTTQDSLLSYTIRRDGTYFIKIKAWDYPGAGSPNHYYQLLVTQDLIRPPLQVNITYPQANRFAPGVPFTIRASANDYDGGAVASVTFYWHGPYWPKPEWSKLGTDSDGSDGWSYAVNPVQYGGIAGSAVYAQALSKSGGILGTVLWDLRLDQTTPVTQLEALPGQINSSVVLLKWNAFDAANDIDHFELQVQANTGAGWSGWINWTGRALPGTLRSTWFTGMRGASYRLRLRGVDRAGNVEAYPDTPEAVTAFASTCTPDPTETQSQSIDSAIPLVNNKVSTVYNLCSSTSPGTGDVDWISFTAQQGEDLGLMFLPESGGAAFSITLYNSSHQVLATWQSADYGNSLGIHWIAPVSGTFFVEIKPLQTSLFGTDALYRVWYGPAQWYYLPYTGN
jgi:hypothetical protein